MNSLIIFKGACNWHIIIAILFHKIEKNTIDLLLKLLLFLSTRWNSEAAWCALNGADAVGSGVRGGGGGQGGGLPVQKELALSVGSIIHTRINNTIILVKFVT